MRQKKIAAFLFVLLFIQSVAIYPVFQGLIMMARIEAQQKIHFVSDDQLVKFRLQGNSDAKTDMQLVGDDEISVKGSMFDIIERHTLKDGSVEYTCFDDSHETQINAAFFKAMEKDNTLPFGKAAKAFSKMAETAYLYQQNFATPVTYSVLTPLKAGYECLPHPRNPEYLTETPPPRPLIG